MDRGARVRGELAGMKQVLRLLAIVTLAFAASCGDHTAVTPVQSIVTPLSVAKPDSIPQTVHVIPFYNYGKSGYEPLDVPGGSGTLIGSETALYGATVSGGSTTCSTQYDTGTETGCGIVYRLVPNMGKRRYKIDVLHTFEGGSGDGAASLATLLADKKGNLYGTTFYGGEYDGGTLFKLHPTSSGYRETILHSFGYGEDGAYPISGVIEVDGTLYGTTLGGGAYSKPVCKEYAGVPNGTCGTVYRVNPATGSEHVLHSFGGKVGDGLSPFAAPLDVDGTLYGTTDLGGSSGRCGTVFKLAKDGRGERVVHSFLNAGQGDGCNPFGSLIDVDGTLYGTTCCGGGNFCSNHCEGTLFSVDLTTGKEEVLHEFGEPGDGSQPVAALVNVNGVLYGTTNIGGSGGCAGGNGCGVIFSLAPSQSSPAYNVLYQFSGGADGASPRDTLLFSHGAFYGTTTSGGKKGFGTGIKLRL
jgi:uncharacterized repeat protein (TIGR03803 family)